MKDSDFYLLLFFIVLIAVRFGQMNGRLKTAEAQIDSITVILSKIAEVMPDRFKRAKWDIVESAIWDLRPGRDCLDNACKALQSQDSIKAEYWNAIMDSVKKSKDRNDTLTLVVPFTKLIFHYIQGEPDPDLTFKIPIDTSEVD